jgi:hypothetical protein
MEWIVALMMMVAQMMDWSASGGATVATVLLPYRDGSLYAITCVVGCERLEYLAPNYRALRWGTVYEALTFYPALVYGQQPEPLTSPRTP